MALLQYNDRTRDVDAFNDESRLVYRADKRYPFDYIDTVSGSLVYTKERAYPVPAMMADATHAFAPCW